MIFFIGFNLKELADISWMLPSFLTIGKVAIIKSLQCATLHFSSVSRLPGCGIQWRVFPSELASARHCFVAPSLAILSPCA
jgi:hypothetical protein